MASSAAEALLHDGHLDEALGQLQIAVRNNPADPKLRVFLFQVLAVRGEWQRALTQLQVVGELDASTLAMVQTYREAIRCELLRERVFSGLSTPVAFGEPRPWFAMMVESLRLLSEGQYEASASWRNQAFEAAPATPGMIDGQPFEWIADADTRLGPLLEVILNGKYYWMPFETLRRIEIEPPGDLRDVIWMPAHFVFANGGDSVGLIPTRYPGSAENGDPLLRLSRKTVWSDAGAGAYLGLGQRVLATDAGEYALMDIREIVLGDAEAG